jgi:hypothetical protein
VPTHFNLGHLLQTERKDIDGAEEAYRAAIAADPTHTVAHRALHWFHGLRHEFGRAEPACRAASAAGLEAAAAQGTLEEAKEAAAEKAMAELLLEEEGGGGPGAGAAAGGGGIGGGGSGGKKGKKKRK